MKRGTYIRTPEIKVKMSIAQKQYMRKYNHQRIGCFCSKKTKLKLSISHKGLLAGSKNPNWIGGKIISRDGYVLIYKPEHPFCNKQKYYTEHRLVMEKHLGRFLEPKEIVHHINGNVSDNCLENLMLFPNNAKHLNYHKFIRDGKSL